MNLAPIPSLLLELSLLGSLFALFVLLMRGLGRKWLPAGLFTLAWLLVGLRLLSPVTPDSPLSLLNVRPSLNRFMARHKAEIPVVLQENPAPWMNIDPLPETIVPSESAPTDRSPDPLHLASAIWLAGFLGLSGLSLLGHLRFSRKLSTTDQSSAPAPSDRLERLLKEAAEVTGLRRPLPLRFSHDIHGPCLCGIFRPAIVLPVGLAASLNDQDVRLIFQHEMTHARRRDPWLHGLLGLAAVCHWFNPVAWWARRACRQDCELATDAALIRTSTSQDRGNYARLLLDVARLSRNQRSRSSFFIRHSALAFALPMASTSKLNLKHRITMINHPHKKHPLARFSALVLLGLATLAVGTSAVEPQEAQPDSPKRETELSSDPSVCKITVWTVKLDRIGGFNDLENASPGPWTTEESLLKDVEKVGATILTRTAITTKLSQRTKSSSTAETTQLEKEGHGLNHAITLSVLVEAHQDGDFILDMEKKIAEPIMLNPDESVSVKIVESISTSRIILRPGQIRGLMGSADTFTLARLEVPSHNSRATSSSVFSIIDNPKQMEQ